MRTGGAVLPAPSRPPVAVVPVAVVAGCVAAVLLAVSGRYGYHRDELYFLAAGHHPAWGYPDQPPLVPLLARLMAAISPGSVVVLRLPSVLATVATVAVTALTARELGAGRAAQALAAASMAVGAFTIGSGHLLSTSTLDLLAWTVVLWLVVRILRFGDNRLWLVVGLCAGVGLLANDLVAFLMFGIVAGMLIAGPRAVFASPYLWVGGAIALLMWAPYLGWQATHSWPELDVASNIASGGSGTSQPRSLFLPFQLALLSPWLVPVWGTGLVRLFRDPGLRSVRAIGWCYVVLAALFLVTGGKGYYLGGMFPVLLGAGVQPVIDWTRRGRAGLRRGLVIAAVVLSLPAFLVALPVVPQRSLTSSGVGDANYDLGETVGWPAYVAEIAGVYRTLPPAQRAHTVVLASNYGEAGAVDRYGPAAGLPSAYSGHNGFYYWGPPPADATTVIAVGLPERELRERFASVRLATRLNNHQGVDDDEQGVHVWVCSGLRGTWAAVWPRFRDIG